MSDDHPRELISAWLDGEVREDERAIVESHLQRCESCRALVDDLRTLGRATASESAPPVPASLAGRIGWSLRSTHRRPARSRWKTVVPLTAAASILAVGLLVVLRVQDRPALPIPDPRTEADDEKPEAAEALQKNLALAEPEVPEDAPAPVLRDEDSFDAGTGEPRTPEREKKDERVSMTEQRRRESRVDAPKTDPSVRVGPDALDEADAFAPSPSLADRQGVGSREESAPDAATAETEAGRKPQERVRAARFDEPRVLGDATAACRSTWLHPADPVVIRPEAAGDDAARTLSDLAGSLGGIATIENDRERTRRLTVPRGRWTALLESLDDLGAKDARWLSSPPVGVECVGLLVRVDE